MASGKADRKASAVEGVMVSIERWQADTVVRKDYEAGTGSIGSLFNSLVELLGLLLVDMKSRPNMSQHCQSLESSTAALFFWGTDLGVSQGELDEVLQDSAQLRETCLQVLVSIGHFIVSSFVSLISSKDRQKEILDSTGIAPSLEQAMNIIDQQQSPAYQPEQNEEALCRTLRMKIDTLMMLSPSLASPAEESFDDEEPRAIGHVEEHLPEQAYINSVAQRFPLAAPTVVTHLGKLNWERYNHMLRLQRNAIQQELDMRIMEKAKTIFHDSAIGSSVPAQSEARLNTPTIPPPPQSVYAPTMVSSRAQASHRRLPPLPPQARSGQPFTCAICNKQVRYQRTKAWKNHIFDDILAYACFFDECSVADIFFDNRDAMMSHLEQCHGLDVSIAKVTCPLCIKYTSSDRDALSLHFARHMEEIALAVLPSCVDSDEESENDTPSEPESRIEENTSFNGIVAKRAAFFKDDWDTSSGPSSSSGDEDGRLTARDIAKMLFRDTNYNVNSTEELNDEIAEEDEVTRCICGHQEFPGLPSHEDKSSSASIDHNALCGSLDGLLIQCDICKAWQHGGCVGIVAEAATPDEYFCTKCRQDLHKIMISSKGQKYSKYLPVSDHSILKPKANATPDPSSSWSFTERQDFEKNIAHFGADSRAIADHIGVKTPTTANNHYLRLVEGGKANRAELAKARGEQKKLDWAKTRKRGKVGKTTPD